MSFCSSLHVSQVSLPSPNLQMRTSTPILLSWVDAGLPGESVGFCVGSFPQRIVQRRLAWRVLQRVPVALLTHTPQQDLRQLPGYRLGTQGSQNTAMNLFRVIPFFIHSFNKYFFSHRFVPGTIPRLHNYIFFCSDDENYISRWEERKEDTLRYSKHFKKISLCPSNATLSLLHSEG